MERKFIIKVPMLGRKNNLGQAQMGYCWKRQINGTWILPILEAAW